jgi:hypothetical protein
MPYELKVRILTGGDSTVDLSGHAGANLDHFGKRVLLARSMILRISSTRTVSTSSFVIFRLAG